MVPSTLNLSQTQIYKTTAFFFSVTDLNFLMSSHSIDGGWKWSRNANLPVKGIWVSFCFDTSFQISVFGQSSEFYPLLDFQTLTLLQVFHLYIHLFSFPILVSLGRVLLLTNQVQGGKIRIFSDMERLKNQNKTEFLCIFLRKLLENML